MKYSSCIAAVAGAAVLSGCMCCPQEAENNNVIDARYTDTPVVVDGVLDDAAWQGANMYPLLWNPAWGRGQRSLERHGGEQWEHGYAKLSWDDEYVYVAVDFEDRACLFPDN